MKAWITSNGQLVIQPETTTEHFALEAWEKCRGKLGQATSNGEMVIPRDAIFLEALKVGKS